MMDNINSSVCIGVHVYVCAFSGCLLLSKGQVLTLWLCLTDESLRVEGHRTTSSTLTHTHIHSYTLVYTRLDRWKCRNNPEVSFCLLAGSNFTTIARLPFIAISRSAHLSEAAAKDPP